MPGKARRINMDKIGGKLKFPPRPKGSKGGIFFNWEGYDEWQEVRFIQPWDDTDEVWIGHCCHYQQIGANRSGWAGLDGSGQNRAITCSKYHDEISCPVCELIAYCEERKQDAKGIGPKVQWLTNVIVDGQVKVWGRTPVTVIKKLKALVKNPRFGPTIFDPVNGRAMEIIRTGSKDDLQSIEYSIETCDPSEITVPDWEKQVKTLSKFIIRYDRARVIQVLEAQVGDFLPVRDCFRKELREIEKGGSKHTRATRPTPAQQKRARIAGKKTTKKKPAGRKPKVTAKKKTTRRR